MPRVHYVKKARKDNAVAKKGEPYYWWKFRFGGKHLSTSYPRPSQLTQSAFMGPALSIVESLEGLTDNNIEDAVSYAISEIEELRDETQEKLDNMPESLQEGPTGELLQERVEALESWLSELESMDFENSDLETLQDELDSMQPDLY